MARFRPDMLDMDVEAKRFDRYMKARREHEQTKPDERFDIDVFVAEVLEKEYPWIDRKVSRDPWDGNRDYTRNARQAAWRKRQREKKALETPKPYVVIGGEK